MDRIAPSQEDILADVPDAKHTINLVRATVIGETPAAAREDFRQISQRTLPRSGRTGFHGFSSGFRGRSQSGVIRRRPSRSAESAARPKALEKNRGLFTIAALCGQRISL
jgi:hypothetical protein